MRRFVTVVVTVTALLVSASAPALAADDPADTGQNSAIGVSPDADPDASAPDEPVDDSTADLPDKSDGEFMWMAEPPSIGSEFSSRERDTVSALAAKVWAACGLFDDSHKLVRAFSRSAANTTVGAPGYVGSGSTNLKCGSEKWGYNHLLKHRSEWETNAAIEGEKWRDLADFGIAIALIDPDAVSYRQSNDTYCYSRKIYLIDKRTGRVAATKKPKVAIAAVSKNVITAYITNAQCNSGGS